MALALKGVVFMKVTKVVVKKVDKENSRLRGYASIVIDDSLKIRDIRIIEGEERLFIAMPSRKMAEDKFIDVVNPINTETRELFENAIIEEYNKAE